MSLLIKNQLKTTVNIGNAENLGKITLPSESEGIFASWCGKLNRQPKSDIFQKSPLNKVKTQDNDNIKELMLEAKHKKMAYRSQFQNEKIRFQLSNKLLKHILSFMFGVKCESGL